MNVEQSMVLRVSHVFGLQEILYVYYLSYLFLHYNKIEIYLYDFLERL